MLPIVEVDVFTALSLLGLCVVGAAVLVGLILAVGHLADWHGRDKW